MAWAGSDRRSTLPADWAERVRKVKARAKGRCEQLLPSGARCPRLGADVDHKVRRDLHEIWALQLLCRHHHDQKTAKEAWQGKRRRRKGPGRPEEPHPGIRRT